MAIDERTPSPEDRRQCPVCRTAHARPHCDEQLPATAVIGLTEHQALGLVDHLGYASRQAREGSPGAVVAQLYHKLSDHSRPGFVHGCLRVTFFDRERAELVTDAGYAKVKAKLAERQDLIDACNGLLGLLQLVQGRCDPELLDIFRTNHRVVDALALLQKISGGDA